MKKFIKKTKAVIKDVHWPTKKEVAADTFVTVTTTVILSCLIMVWTSGIDKVIDWVLSLF